MTYRGKTLSTGLAVALAGAVLAVAPAVLAPAAPAQAQSSDVMPSFNGTVLTVAYKGTTAYVGGDFTAAIVNGKPVPRARLAAIDARTGTLLPWAPAADGRVKSLVVNGSAIYLAGDFGTIGGLKRDSLAKVNASTGAVAGGLKHTITGRPTTLAIGGTRLYLGGAITDVDGQPRGGLAAFSLRTGKLDTGWRPTADSLVEVLATAPGRVYAGGKFRKINGTPGYERLAALDHASGAILTGFQPRPQFLSYALAVTPDGLYAAHGGSGGRVSAYTAAGRLRWSVTFDGDAQAVTVLDGVVYAGGHFDRACNTARSGAQGSCIDGSDNRIKLAALNTADGRLLDWTADANGVEGVLALANTPKLNAIAMGGAFTMIEGRQQKRFAQFRF